MEDVVQVWKSAFLPIQQEIESFTTIANGKGVRGEDDRRGSHSNGFSLRRPSYNRNVSSTSPSRNLAPPVPNIGTKPKIGETLVASSPSGSTYLGVKSPSPVANSPGYASEHYTTPTPSQASAGSRNDYFSRGRQPASNPTSTGTGLATIGKKKPPPPPPSRTRSENPAVYVTALYDFEGQGAGDLVFKEGDRIRVLKKTESTDDWWEGELRGVKGSFPANYCQ